MKFLIFNRVKYTLIISFIAIFFNSCISTRGFIREDVEGASMSSSRIRSEYKIGNSGKFKSTAIKAKLVLGIIPIGQEKDFKAMYNDCLDKVKSSTGNSAIGFYESRGTLKTIKIPSILTLGVIGLTIYKLDVTGQPYYSKSDSDY